MESNTLYEEKKGGVVVSLYALTEDDRLNGISFPCVSKDGKGLNMMINLTPYGLKCDYEGEGKETVLSLLKKIENKLKKNYGLTFEEEPKFEIVEPETSEE